MEEKKKSNKGRTIVWLLFFAVVAAIAVYGFKQIQSYESPVQNSEYVGTYRVIDPYTDPSNAAYEKGEVQLNADGSCIYKYFDNRNYKEDGKYTDDAGRSYDKFTIEERYTWSEGDNSIIINDPNYDHRWGTIWPITKTQHWYTDQHYRYQFK